MNGFSRCHNILFESFETFLANILYNFYHVLMKINIHYIIDLIK